MSEEIRSADALLRENAALRARLDSVMHAGDMEHARMAALIEASQDMINQLALLTRDDSAALWRIGGNPLQDAYKALIHATTAVRVQADAFLAELAAARAVAETLKDVLAREQSQSALTVALAKYDAAMKARPE
jgi:CRP-like cAMP-binding protein